MEINLHPGQSQVYNDLLIENNIRFGVVNCARGWGKSYLAATVGITCVFELLELSEYIPHKIVYIIAPTYDQVTDIYYPLLNYELGLEQYCLRSSKDQGRFLFENKVELRLLSYESIERLRGKGAYAVIWDEVSSCKKGIKPKDAWEGVIMPAISSRWSPKRAARFGARSPGRGLMISTPKGYNFFYEAFHKGESDPLWKGYHFDYHSSPILDPDEIERIKATTDPVTFASEYLASFEESGNRVFYCFDRKEHVNNAIEDFGSDETVHLAIDFNVGLQCTSAFAVRGGEMQFIDNFKGHPDTETLAIAMSTKYKGKKIIAYPDPSGRFGSTKAPVGRTDFSILESYGIRCIARPKAPPLIDSVNSVNKQLKNARGGVAMRFHPRCDGVIKSMERTKWVDNNAQTITIDKSEGVEHYSDGVRYATEYLFPITNFTKRTSRGEGF